MPNLKTNNLLQKTYSSVHGSIVIQKSKFYPILLLFLPCLPLQKQGTYCFLIFKQVPQARITPLFFTNFLIEPSSSGNFESFTLSTSTPFPRRNTFAE